MFCKLVFGLSVILVFTAAKSTEFAYDFEQRLLKIDLNKYQEVNYNPKNLAPYGILKLDDAYELVFWYSLAQGRLLIFGWDGKNYTHRKTYRISIGKNGYNKIVEGDKRTPIGIYFYQKFKTDKELNDYYGLGAFPIDYPNAYDKIRNRTGYGIWLHGYPKGVLSRPLLDSLGCMVVSNTNFEKIKPLIDSHKSIVILQDYFQWGDKSKSKKLYKLMHRQLKKWSKYYNKNKLKAFLSFYSKDLYLGDMTVLDFKKNIKETLLDNKAKKNKIAIDNISILLYPATDNIVFVEFDRIYKSGKVVQATETIRQYWKLSNSAPQIIYEAKSI